MKNYSTIITKVSGLDDMTRHSIVELYLNHFDESEESLILKDLEEKQDVLLLYHEGVLVGFTTMDFYTHQWSGELVRIVFSGDTVVDRAHWGQQALAFRWIEYMGKVKAEQPGPLYWFLIVKGHRTFRYLPTFAKSFYPHWSNEPSDLKPLADSLATERFGSFYNPENGVVEFDKSRGQLKEEIAYPSPQEMKKASVRFFLEKNPEYLKGHELVCLCKLETENMKPLSKRVFNKANK